MSGEDAPQHGPCSMDAIMQEIRTNSGDDATLSVDELVTLSPTSVEAVLSPNSRVGSAAPSSEPPSEPVPSLEALLRETPDSFGLVGDGPGSLETLFNDLTDDPDEWYRPAERQPAWLSTVPPKQRGTLRPPPLRGPAGPSSPPSLPPRRKSKAPSVAPLGLASTTSIPPLPHVPQSARPAATTPSVAPVSMSAPLSLDTDAEAEAEDSSRLGRRWRPLAYVVALIGAGAVGAGLGSQEALRPDAVVPLALPGTLGALADRSVAAAQAAVARAPGSHRATALPAETAGAEQLERAPLPPGFLPPNTAPGTVPRASQPAGASPSNLPAVAALQAPPPAAPDQSSDEPSPTPEVARTAAPDQHATAAVAASAPFDRQAANQALQGAAAAAAGCPRGQHVGTVRVPVAVTFAPSGRATTAVVTGSALAGTSAGSCVAQALRQARVQPYAGSFVTVTKTVTLP